MGGEKDGQGTAGQGMEGTEINAASGEAGRFRWHSSGIHNGLFSSSEQVGKHCVNQHGM